MFRAHRAKTNLRGEKASSYGSQRAQRHKFIYALCLIWYFHLFLDSGGKPIDLDDRNDLNSLVLLRKARRNSPKAERIRSESKQVSDGDRL